YHAEEGYLAATMEQIGIHVSMESRRSAVMPDWVLAELQDLKDAHKNLPIKPQVGRVIGIPKKSAGATSA
ncbi:MAG: thioesterase, partial [Pseudomonadota bacterium]